MQLRSKGEEPLSTAKKIKIGEKIEKWNKRAKMGRKGENLEIKKNIGKKRKKSGTKVKNQEDFFTLPLLTDRAGYAAGVK